MSPQPTRLPTGEDYPVAHLRLLPPHVINEGGKVPPIGSTPRTRRAPIAEITDLVLVDQKGRAYGDDGVQLTNRAVNQIVEHQELIRDHPNGTNYP